jgi:hypothetical protein
VPDNTRTLATATTVAEAIRPRAGASSRRFVVPWPESLYAYEFADPVTRGWAGGYYREVQ